ncbi:hypothetical protein [Neisseria meningitidis]|nr:hypothetical protein [Neisseria meningitidis]
MEKIYIPSGGQAGLDGIVRQKAAPEDGERRGAQSGLLIHRG